MKNHTKISIAAIVCITTIVVVGLLKGIDGVLAGVGLSTIAGLAGYRLGRSRTR